VNEHSNDHSDPYGVITSAEQLVAGLWQAERDEEKAKDAPPGSEAVEDEIKALETAIDQELRGRMAEDPDMAGYDVHFRAFDIDRLKGADVPLWRVGGCFEGRCGASECETNHHSPQLFLVTKRGDGGYAILEDEEVIDERDKNQECFMRGTSGVQGMIRIDLGEIIGKAVRDAVSEQVKEQAETHDGGEDDLPPAASVEDVPDKEMLSKIKETALGRPLTSEEERNLNASWDIVQARTEQTAPARKIVGADDVTETRLPVIDIDEYRLVRYDEDNAGRPGWLRRAWRWLLDWLRS
jgi:hypothetical protein